MARKESHFLSTIVDLLAPIYQLAEKYFLTKAD